MSAPTRLRPPSRRHVARGSAVGLGLLVASTAFAPAALAADDATDPAAPDTSPDADAPAAGPVLVARPAPSAAVSGPVAADFGSGKQFSLAVAVDGDAPTDLDLSGARFALTDGHGDLAATCVTAADGTCTIVSGSAGGEGTVVSVPGGTYTLTQETAVDGLTAVSGAVGTLTMAPWLPIPVHRRIAVTDVSEYSQQVQATVVDAATGDPLPDAEFSLTGPAYPSTDPDAPESYDSGPVASDEDGLLTFDGWFRPEDWTLTPGTVPDGYVLGDELTVTVPATPGFAGPHAWALADPIEVLAAAPPAEETPGGDSGGPSTTPTPPVVVPPAPVAPPAVPSSSAPASSSAPSRQRPVAPVAPDVQEPSPAPAPEPVAVPTVTYDGRSSLPQDDRAPNTDPAPALLATPQLATASSSFPEVGLVGIGILFVAVVAGGVVLLRRRLRG